MSRADHTGAGWEVEVPGSKNLTTVTVAGERFIVKRGYHGRIGGAMKHLIETLNSIEPISEPGWDGSYCYRNVRGGKNWSEHSAGVAYDHNASQHGMGGEAYAGWSKEQVGQIYAFLNTPEGKMFKWGADFHGRKDPMHFEMREPALWGKLWPLFAKYDLYPTVRKSL